MPCESWFVAERAPRVVMVVNNPISHDARVVKSARSLARAGAEVDVLGVSPDTVEHRAMAAGVRFRRLPVLPPRGITPGYARWAARRRVGRLFPAPQWRRTLPVTGYYRRAFLSVLRDLRPDVVHAHDVHLLGTVSEYVADAVDRPHVIYDAHEYVPGLAVGGARSRRVVDAWAALERETIHRADRVITVAPGIAALLAERYSLDRTPTVVYNAPIAGTAKAPRSLRAAAGVGAEVALVVYSGALSAARGVDTVVTALRLLPEVHLAVVAVPFPNKLGPHLQAIAAQSGAAGRLHLVAPVASHDVPAYLSEADVGVSPILGSTSISYDLSLPNKLFEFLHAGLPMVVSDCRGAADFVARHQLGRSFHAGDPDDLAAALRAVLADPPRPDTADLRREFSWQTQEPRLVAVYQDIVAGLTVPIAPFPDEDVTPRWIAEPADSPVPDGTLGVT